MSLTTHELTSAPVRRMPSNLKIDDSPIVDGADAALADDADIRRTDASGVRPVQQKAVHVDVDIGAGDQNAVLVGRDGEVRLQPVSAGQREGDRKAWCMPGVTLPASAFAWVIRITAADAGV